MPRGKGPHLPPAPSLPFPSRLSRGCLPLQPGPWCSPAVALAPTGSFPIGGSRLGSGGILRALVPRPGALPGGSTRLSPRYQAPAVWDGASSHRSGPGQLCPQRRLRPPAIPVPSGREGAVGRDTAAGRGVWVGP